MKIDKIIIFTLSFLIFSNAIAYTSKANIISLNSAHLFLLTTVFTSYMVFKKLDFSFINIKLNWWIVFYLCVILFWFILPHNDFSIGELQRKILSIASIFIFMVFIFYDDENTSTVMKAILFTTLISIFNNIYEFINPFAFFSIDSNVGVFGRSAGFYKNPTISGGAIVLGTILSIEIIPKIYRTWFLILSFVGIFLTFSRAAIIGFLLVYFFMTLKKLLDFKYTVLIPILFSIVLTLSIPFLTQYVEATYGGSASNIINRTMWFLDPVDHEDWSQGERLELTEKAFDKFVENPFFGAGLGSTTARWNEKAAHNIYLTNMAEFGFLGIFVYPLLIYLITQLAKGETKRIAVVFAIFTLFIGLFSHNILDEFYFLFAFAFMAVLSYKSTVKINSVNNFD